jgi:hypothetical protein
MRPEARSSVDSLAKLGEQMEALPIRMGFPHKVLAQFHSDRIVDHRA